MLVSSDAAWQVMGMTRVMITGANGRVGRLLRPWLGEAVIWCRRGPGEALDWDPLAGPAPLLAYCESHGAPDAVIQLGRGDDRAIGLATVAAARKAGIPRVLLASSSAVYGFSRDADWDEGDPTEPPSPYGQSKLAMERACAGPGVTMLRIGNVAGADALLTNPRRPLLLDRFPNGAGPLRNYIGPQTLARVLIALAKAHALPPILNLAAPRPVDMADLARAAGLPVERQPAPPHALARLTLATTRLEQIQTFEDTDSDPAAMVAQWQDSLRPA